MQLAARPCTAAAAALVASSVIAVAPAVTPPLPEIHMPAIQLTAGDSIFGGVDNWFNDLLSEDGFFAALAPGAAAGGPSATIEELMQAFNAELISGEFGFNHQLTSSELGFEEAISPFFKDFPGYVDSHSILNGVVNRSFNVFNMFIDTGEHTVSGLVGASAPVDVNGVDQLTFSLILGGQQAFNDGTIGGLEGVLGQGYMAFTDFLGLFTDHSLLTADLASPVDFLAGLNPLDFVSGLIPF